MVENTGGFYMNITPTVSVLETVKMFSKNSDPFEIAKSEGIVIKKSKFPVSRLLVVDDLCTWIYLENIDDEELRNFVMWHELGHYFLHYKKGAAKNAPYWEQCFQEIEANEFAAIMTGTQRAKEKAMEMNNIAFFNIAKQVNKKKGETR